MTRKLLICLLVYVALCVGLMALAPAVMCPCDSEISQTVKQ